MEEEELLRCRWGLDGDDTCGEEGPPEDAPLMDSRFKACGRLFVDCSDPANDSFAKLFCDDKCAIALWSAFEGSDGPTLCNGFGLVFPRCRSFDNNDVGQQ